MKELAKAFRKVGFEAQVTAADMQYLVKTWNKEDN